MEKESWCQVLSFQKLVLIFCLLTQASCGLTGLDGLLKSNANSGGSQTEPSKQPPPSYGHPELPAPSSKLALEKSGNLAGKTFVTSVLIGVFRSSTYYAVSSGQNRLDTAVEKWVGFHSELFGTGCNPWSSYTFADCGSLGMDSAGAANTPYALASSALRQLNKSRACEDVLDIYQFPTHMSVFAAAEKIGGLANATTLNELNDTIITKMHALFFRSRAIKPEELTIYRNFNTQMKNDSPVVPLVDRYRALLLVMCEDPEWEVL